jgi:hypothetical protein
MSIAFDELTNSQVLREGKPTIYSKDVASLVISLYLCTWVIILALVASSEFWHWFILPVWACGVVIGFDAIDWVRGRIPVFDPVGIIGLLGFHFFFLAPLLHVYWDYWMRFVTPPDEWRFWLGWMAVLNFLGLLVYHFVRSRWKPKAIRTVWRVDNRRFFPLLFLFLLFTGALQLWVYAQYGGILGYIGAYEARFELSAFVGMGWIFSFSESFPILFLFGYVYFARRSGKLQSWQAIITFLTVFFILRLLFGGLRGSRSNTIWALFWAVGVIYFWIRPFSRRLILLSIPLLVGLMYIGGLYKGVGLSLAQDLRSISAIRQLGDETGRTLESTLLTDLGRSDVQALLLSRIIDQTTNYELAFGRTYIGAISILVPRSLWPNRPPGKVKEGTEILYGKGMYEYGRTSSRVYGLAGETILNFGFWLVPVAFIILGAVVSYVRGIMGQLDRSDVRLLLLPLLIIFCFVVLVLDSDNILFFIVKNGLVPFLFVFLSSRIFRISRG